MGGEPVLAGLGTAVLARGGGESARAKGGAWESVVEDGELVVGGSTVCVGSANLTKKRRRRSDDACERSRPAHPE